MRVIACDFSTLSAGSTSQSAMIYGDRQYQSAGGWKVYGNYIHDTHAPGDNKFHTTYFTYRYWLPNINGYHTSMVQPDISWNYLKNNQNRFGLHFYDKGTAEANQGRGQYDGVLIHDNVVEDQDGYGIGFNTGGGDHIWTLNDVNVYNNVLIRCGLNRAGRSGGTYQSAIYFSGDTGDSLNGFSARVRLYNNTIVDPGLYAITMDMVDGASSWDWRNNIVYASSDIGYWSTGAVYINPAIHTNNLWYYAGGAKAAPAWDTSPIIADPLFVNAGGSDFSLQSGSPAIDAGWNASAVLTKDILGLTRPQGASYDIGAFEYDEGATGDTTPPASPSALSVR